MKLNEKYKELVPYGAVSFDEITTAIKDRNFMDAFHIAEGELLILLENIAYSENITDKAAAMNDLVGGFTERITSIMADSNNQLKVATKKIIDNTTANSMLTEEIVVGEINDLESEIEELKSEIEDLKLMLMPKTEYAVGSPYDYPYKEKSFTKGTTVAWDIPGDKGFGVVVKVNTDGNFDLPYELGNKSKASNTNPILTIDILKETQNGTWVTTGNTVNKPSEYVTKRTLIVTKEFTGSAGITVSKENGRLAWYGVFTNKYKDRHGDIITDAAHQYYVKNVNNGVFPFPDFYIWHIEKSVGTTEYVEYDENGFVVAGGFVHKEFEKVVSDLYSGMKAAGEPMGMSHKVFGLQDKDGSISIYFSPEVSMLPLNEAANLLTSMGVQNE